MRIGTWNMEGRGTARHTEFLLRQECDVLLLTEVKHGWNLGTSYHLTEGGHEMAATKRWAAVASKRDLVECETPPHPASAAATIGSTTYVSSILPWRASGETETWKGKTHAERTQHAVDDLRGFLADQPALVWGGDWNLALSGTEWAGSKAGGQAVQVLLDELELKVQTLGLPHRIPGLITIDHIALGGGSYPAQRVDATTLSDHDFYMVDTPDDPG